MEKEIKDMIIGKRIVDIIISDCSVDKYNIQCFIEMIKLEDGIEIELDGHVEKASLFIVKNSG